MTDTNKPDFKNDNREPVISVMVLASLDDAEMLEGYSDGNAGEPCGDNRSRSYWHGWRTGSLDGKHREKDFWDSMLASNVVPGGDIKGLAGRIAACRQMLRADHVSILA
jgi:hypothetical protein